MDVDCPFILYFGGIMNLLIEVDTVKINNNIGNKKIYNLFSLGKNKEYLASIVFNCIYEYECFDVLTKFILNFIGIEVEYNCIYNSHHTSDEFDDYSYEIDYHIFDGFGKIEVKYGDFDEWENTKLEEYLLKMSKLLNLKINLIRYN